MIPTYHEILNRMYRYYLFFIKHNDHTSANRLKDLIKKVDQNELVFTFTGHYSAGKSSLINELLEAQVLPSSPIPTTSHIIRVTGGKNYIKLNYLDGKTVLYNNFVDMNDLQKIDKQEEIKDIEIGCKDSVIPPQVILMDTPGIDSTESAHHLSAESSIHLADILFYMVDYNHVQSELNLDFTKALYEKGKDFVLIVNQMDKHRPEEISLQSFKQSVVDAFIKHGIKPIHTFFISVKDKEWQGNEWNFLKQYMDNIIKEKEKILPNSIHQSFHKILFDHTTYMENKYQEGLIPLEQILQDATSENELYETEEEELKKQIDSTLYNDFRKFIHTIESEMLTIIKNAYIMPYKTRELGELYLEAQQKSFKMGLFSGKQKKQEEKNRRLHHFYDELNKAIQLHLLSPLLQYFTKIANEENSNVLQQQINSATLTYSLDINDLKRLINQQAHFSEEYVLRYCEEVELFVKKQIQKEAEHYIQMINNHAEKKYRERKQELSIKLINTSKWKEAKQQKMHLGKQYVEWKDKMNALSDNQQDLSTTYKVILKEEKHTIINELPSNFGEKNESTIVENKMKEINEEKLNKEKVLANLDFYSSKLQTLTGFEQTANHLLSKAANIKDKQYTLCLFGAFSAGKSSFANSLLDYPLLPVSPNPTTSTITSIKPVNEENIHGTVKVKWKETEELWIEINEYLELFNKKAGTLSESFEIMENVLKEQTGDFPAAKRYFEAVLKGHKQNVKWLGTITTTDYNQLADYVSIEENSCFVSKLDVYFDCILTKKGITLVDTPGGDSVNSRHTNVSFDYLKTADLILYVTYYNHAFSRADQSFLTQLGRVKETFEKDKMFFFINAIDLAKSLDEVSMVKEYVREQLQLYGIHHPKLFAISSLYYKEPSYKEFFLAFQKNLNEFMEQEWMQMLLLSAQKDMNQTKIKLENLFHSAESKKQESKIEIDRLVREKEKIETVLLEQTFTHIEEKLINEIDEQLYYVNQRMFYQINKIIKRAFHPSILKGKNKKTEWNQAIQEFLRDFSYEWEQELRATNLRIEYFCEKQRKVAIDYFQEMIYGLNRSLILQIDEKKEIETLLVFRAPFREISSSLIHQTISSYRNPKSFFEKNERKTVAIDIENMLIPIATEFIKTESQNWHNFYKVILDKELSLIVQETLNQVHQFYTSSMIVMTDDEYVKKVKNILQEIKSK